MILRPGGCSVNFSGSFSGREPFCNMESAVWYSGAGAGFYDVDYMGKRDMSYYGDVTAREAWEALMADESAVLVDVRTQPEWAFVGISDLSGLNKMPLLASWQDYPHMAVNPAFADMIAGEDIALDSPLYFLCRSGVRSRSAAQAMTRAGYKKCFNILGGFEGDRDPAGHRGQQDGWKAAGLPWTQN